MSARTEALQAKASEERSRLSASFDALERNVDQVTDWRMRVRRDPVKPLIFAAIAGVLLGAATTTRSSRSDRPFRERLSPRGRPKPMSAATAAMIRYAGALALEFLSARALGALSRKPSRRP